jgi:uncharacterized Zn finger protein (UPF0148 family)
MSKLTDESSETPLLREEYQLFSDEDESFKSCPICCEDFILRDGNFPVLLRCAHSICQSCAMDALRYSEDGFMECPICNDMHKIEHGRPSFFWDFPSLLDLSKEVAQVEKSVSKIQRQLLKCKSCSLEDYEMFDCLECNMLLCSNCQIPHKSFPTTANHKVYKIKGKAILQIKEYSRFQDESCCRDIQEEYAKVYTNIDSFNKGIARCSMHSSMIIYQCEVDGEFLCPYCLIYNHNGHRVNSLNDRFSIALENLEFSKQEQFAADVKTKFEELRNELEQNQKKLHQDYEYVSEMYCYNLFEALETRLHELKTAFREKVSSAFKEKMSFLCQKRFEVQTLLENLDTSQLYLKNALDAGLVVNSLVISQQIDRMIQEFDLISPIYQEYLSGRFLRINKEQLQTLENILSQTLSQFIQVTWQTPSRGKKEDH